jgi:hypothetical protein
LWIPQGDRETVLVDDALPTLETFIGISEKQGPNEGRLIIVQEMSKDSKTRILKILYRVVCLLLVIQVVCPRSSIGPALASCNSYCCHAPILSTTVVNLFNEFGFGIPNTSHHICTLHHPERQNHNFTFTIHQANLKNSLKKKTRKSSKLNTKKHTENLETKLHDPHSNSTFPFP